MALKFNLKASIINRPMNHVHQLQRTESMPVRIKQLPIVRKPPQLEWVYCQAPSSKRPRLNESEVSYVDVSDEGSVCSDFTTRGYHDMSFSGRSDPKRLTKDQRRVATERNITSVERFEESDR